MQYALNLTFPSIPQRPFLSPAPLIHYERTPTKLAMNPEDTTAATQPPDEETETSPEDTTAEPSFGWNSYAETINGRFAMLGFLLLLLLNLFTAQDFFTWLGVR